MQIQFSDHTTSRSDIPAGKGGCVIAAAGANRDGPPSLFPRLT
jgi:hypothetical protein